MSELPIYSRKCDEELESLRASIVALADRYEVSARNADLTGHVEARDVWQNTATELRKLGEGNGRD